MFEVGGGNTCNNAFQLAFQVEEKCFPYYWVFKNNQYRICRKLGSVSLHLPNQYFHTYFVVFLSNITGLAECFACPEGSYCYDGLRPVSCPKGHYCPTGSHDKNWQKCPPGTYNPSVSFLLCCLILSGKVSYVWTEN